MNGHGERNIRLRIKRLAGMTARIRFLLLLAGVMLAVMWIVPQTAYMATSGNGPGGVGMTGGGSTLELWLRADKGVFSDSGCSTVAADGNSVGCWQDQSGNLAHAKQQAANNVPTFDTNTSPLNGQPVLNFIVNAGVGQLLESDPAHPVSLGALTVFAVFNAANGGMVYEHNNRGATPDGSNLFTSNFCTTTVNRGGFESNKSLALNWAADGVSRIVTQGYSGTHTDHTISVNDANQTFLGTPCPTANGSDSPGTGSVVAPVYVGSRSGGTIAPLQGNIAELIFFSEVLPAVQKILVENYLSSKYGVALASNDYYDGDTPANGDFDLDVAGIGQLGGVQNDTAQSVGMTVVDNSFLSDDGDWLLFGHNVSTNGNTTSLLPTASPWDTAPAPARWGRSWYIDVTDAGNNGGTVNITFDFNEGGMGNFTPSDADPSNYRLIKRSAIGNPYTDVAGASSVDVPNKRVTFTGVDVTVLGSDFTLGTLDNNNSPTAVSLQHPISIATQPGGLVVVAACVLTLGLGSLWICLRNRPE